MLDKEAKNIDAVTVSTPDHIHAVATMAAIRAGKHVYCQKPLTHTIHEARELTKAAKVGRRRDADGQPGPRHRRRPAHERVDPGRGHRRGARGPRLVGSGRHASGSRGSAVPPDTPPVPPTLDWDLWLGPVRERPYHPAYLPRPAGAAGGTSAPVRWATWAATSSTIPSGRWSWARRRAVESRPTLDGSVLDGDKLNFETYPIASIIYFEFPARATSRRCG